MSYSAAVATIVFALAMSLGRPRRRKDQTIGFTAVLLALLAHVFGELIIESGFYAVAPHLVGTELSVRMVLGPAVFFYTRALISPSQTKFQGTDWFSLLGPALVIVASVPFSFLSADEKLALVDPATRDPVHFKIAVFTCTASVVLFLSFTTLYLIAALRRQTIHRRDMMRHFADIDACSLDWLRSMLFVFSGVWLLLGVKQAFWVSGISYPPLNLALALSEMMAIAVFAYFGLHQPTLDTEPDSSRAPARTSILADERMQQIAAKLITTLGTNGLYAENDLSLQRLSDAVGISKNHVSETLSQHLGVNFFDFVNKRRIEEASRLLVETDQTILQIGFDVGFNSRSTFNAAFKKHSGLTPSGYRAKIERGASSISIPKTQNTSTVSE